MQNLKGVKIQNFSVVGDNFKLLKNLIKRFGGLLE